MSLVLAPTSDSSSQASGLSAENLPPSSLTLECTLVEGPSSNCSVVFAVITGQQNYEDRFEVRFAVSDYYGSIGNMQP